MISKIAAARIATERRESTWRSRAGGSTDRCRAISRHSLFVADDREVSARKAWLGGGLTAKGAIHVDAGAVAALAKGGSLLAAGAVRVEGRVRARRCRDDRGPGGDVIARGLAEYDGGRGRPRSSAGAATNRRRILGYAPRTALVHRSHLVMM